MRITAVTSTDLFVGSARRALQVIQVSLAGDAADTGRDVSVRVDGAGVTTPAPSHVTAGPPGEPVVAEVAVEVAAPYQAGVARPVTAVAEIGAGTGSQTGGSPQRAELRAQVTPAEPGWTMWMVSHFHYDPVWWGTQGQFTESRLLLPDEDGSLPDIRTAFELVRLHLEKARSDPDYKFVLAEIDYLKPHFDAYPEDRADVRRFIAEGRIELVGGTYNEPNTNLTGAESTVRNAVYGMGFQRDVLGADPRSAWMLDAFGHDPGFPGLMAAAGLTSSAWARGPFHQWGPSGTEGGNRRMQFASEFEWMSPDGTGLLTAYMANHYGAGWAIHGLPDLATAEAEALNQFRSLAAVAATRNVLLPVGSDHVIPPHWVTEIHRDWNTRYVWPRFVTAVPADFFGAVRAEAKGGGSWITPQTRDMNPLYTGKDVSYIDTKQAQRAAEVALLDGERLATLAWLAGAPYPAESLDKAWRQLAYGAHHDAITGTEGDQVYLDLVAGWREAWERGAAARRAAVRHLAGASGPASSLVSSVAEPGADGETTLSVFNTLSWPRSGLARATLGLAEPGAGQVALVDQSGERVPFLAEGVRRHPDGSLAELTVTFRATEVPALGYRAYRALPVSAGTAEATRWSDVPGAVIENERYRVSADPGGGGTLASVVDKETGAEVLRGPGNEVLLADEYPAHPKWGEGPWHLSPMGTGIGSATASARVRAQRCPVGSRLVAEFELDGLAVVQETLLWDGENRVEFRTHVDGSIGQDRMLRVRFPADVPGGLPVYETATAVIGRPLAHPDVDTNEHSWTLDNPAHDWFGVGSTARVALTAPDGARQDQAIGVAEVITPDGLAGSQDGAGQDRVRALIAALAATGVTATCSQADGPRYGAMDADSNLPDVRIALGGPDSNSFTAAALSAAGNGYAKELAGRVEAGGPVRLWLPAARTRAATHQPSADLRGPADLPVLIVTGPGASTSPGGDALDGAIAGLVEDLADSVVDVPAADLAGSPAPADAAGSPAPADPPLADRSVALLNRGTPSGAVSPDGTLTLTLMRACSSWPAGVWIDGDRQEAPDGGSFAWQHWSHTFEYALVSGAGDWRQAGFGPAGALYNHELVTCTGGGPAAVLAPAVSLVEIDPPAVQLSALKPRGNPLAQGRPGLPAAADGLTLRLRETEGRPARARVRLRGGIAAARLTDLLEESDGHALTVAEEEALVDLPPFGTVTAVVWPVVPPAAGLQGEPPVPQGTTNLLAETSVPDGTLAGLLEPAQPVYSRYWLHGKGPAPAGNLPVAVHISPRLSGLPDDGSVARLRVTVACGTEPASGTLRLLVPAELVADFGDPGHGVADADAYDLPARGYRDWDVPVRARPGAPPGRYVIAAQISDDLGQVIEDAVFVQAGGPGEPDLYQPLEEVLPAVQASTDAIAAELGLAVLTPALRLAPGAEAELTAELTNHLASPLRAEAQLVSPYGSWELLGPWTQGVTAGPGQRVPVRFCGRIPSTARPGSQWWVMIKVMYFGRVRYSAAVPVTVISQGEEA